MSAYRSPSQGEMPFHEFIRQRLAKLSDSDVEVFPKPARLAKIRFSIGGEGPLALVDDTVMRSCKVGLLLTTHALYMLRDGFALPHVLGEPTAEHWDGQVLTLDFTLRQGSGVAGAAVSSAVGLALLATVGIGWVSVPKGPTFKHVRCRVCRLPGGSGLRVTGFSGGEVDAPEVAAAVDSGLVVVEQEVLRRRCIMGPDLPVQTLLAIDEATLDQRVRELHARRATS
jgi:hypothetical protein